MESEPSPAPIVKECQCPCFYREWTAVRPLVAAQEKEQPINRKLVVMGQAKRKREVVDEKGVGVDKENSPPCITAGSKKRKVGTR